MLNGSIRLHAVGLTGSPLSGSSFFLVSCHASSAAARPSFAFPSRRSLCRLNRTSSSVIARRKTYVGCPLSERACRIAALQAGEALAQLQLGKHLLLSAIWRLAIVLVVALKLPMTNPGAQAGADTCRPRDRRGDGFLQLGRLELRNHFGGDRRRLQALLTPAGRRGSTGDAGAVPCTQW
jgi:hypothetical protein